MNTEYCKKKKPYDVVKIQVFWQCKGYTEAMKDAVSCMIIHEKSENVKNNSSSRE